MNREMDPEELENIKTSIIEQLKDQYSRGTLEEQRFEELLSRTEEVNDKKDLARLVPHLPPVSSPENERSVSEPYRGGASGTEGNKRDEDTVVTILGDSTRKGVWRVPRYLKVFTFLGDSTVDFSSAQLPRDVINVDVFCLLGEIKIKVPPGVHLEVKGVPILGEFKDRTRYPGEEGAPLIRVSGAAFLGSVKIFS